MKQYLIIENVRSAYNVGAMFRTAEGAGVDQIFLCGYTPTPTDRFGRAQAEIEKTSLGASAIVPWEHVVDCVALVGGLQKTGVRVVAVELTAAAIPLSQFVPNSQAVAYILGNEVTGVTKEVLGVVDQVVCLPMRGQKESLNVSVAAGIVMYYDVLKN